MWRLLEAVKDKHHGVSVEARLRISSLFKRDTQSICQALMGVHAHRTERVEIDRKDCLHYKTNQHNFTNLSRGYFCEYIHSQNYMDESDGGRAGRMLPSRWCQGLWGGAWLGRLGGGEPRKGFHTSPAV